MRECLSSSTDYVEVDKRRPGTTPERGEVLCNTLFVCLTFNTNKMPLWIFAAVLVKPIICILRSLALLKLSNITYVTMGGDGYSIAIT